MSDTQPRAKEAVAISALLEIARDLTASLAARDRYARLLAAIRRVIPYDAACLLRLEGEDLVPVAGHGLAPEALARRYPRRDHPRLDAILRANDPVRFPPDSPLPDPFDGLLEEDPHALERIHACLGCALTEGGEVIGALTADALEPHAFDAFDTPFLATLGALAGAALRTTALIEALERRVEQRGRVARELQRHAIESSGELVGASPVLQRLMEEIAVVAASDLTVLVTGETGVGKERVAHQVHDLSPRRDEALIHVNCAALPEAIAESELFGHVAGAFTGAVRDRAGKFEVADGGTLFLDEVGELPLTLQPKLLRALQSGEIQRVGSDRVHRFDVRVVAATNRDLAREVARGRFRADLYHRLAVFPLRVPPLRDRREDVPLLAAHFADAARRRLGLGPVRLAEPVRARLAAAEWPGNVRELENVVSRAVLRASAGREPGAPVLVEPRHVDVEGAGPATPAADEPMEVPAAAGRPLAERVRDYQRRLIQEAVERSGGSWAAAARELGMHRSNLHHLARRLGLRPMARSLGIAAVLLLAGPLLAACTGPRVSRPLVGRVICIDPGHGGTAGVDQYRVGPGGEREEWIDLRVARMLRDELERRGARVVMTRTEDVAVELRRRAEIAIEGRADLFLSLHHNATADPSVNLPVVYFHGNASENQAGVALGRTVAARLDEALFGGEATPSLVSDYAIFPGRGAAVLRHSYGIPGVISEASFFTNAAEEQRLREEGYNRREAQALARAVEDFLARPIPPIEELGSRLSLPPFEVFRESERMKPEALRWREAFIEARELIERGDPEALEQAYDRLMLSARAFPDSPVAGECHRLRATILARQGRPEEAGRERLRSVEHYASVASPTK